MTGRRKRRQQGAAATMIQRSRLGQGIWKMSRPKLALLFSASKVFLFRKRQREGAVCLGSGKSTWGGVYICVFLVQFPLFSRGGVTVGCQSKGTETLKW